jgi:hypothetical protein
MILKKRIDEKHHMQVDIPEEILKPEAIGDPPIAISLVKTGNGVPVPNDEPVILFRGRDKLAVPMLERYRELCVEDGCNDFQLASMDTMINAFKEFARTSSTMKQPGITRGT